MWWNELSRRRRSVPGKARLDRPQSRHRHRLRPEQLEDRALLTSYTAAGVSDLIADINAANLAGGSNTITLVAGTTFTLTAVDNTFDGATGLPVIAANDNLTIAGNGDVVQRSTATGTPDFRLLDVAAGASLTPPSLTLQNLTLQGGVAAATIGGGAIHNFGGTLTLNSVTIQNNLAGGIGSGAYGGGIYSQDGSLMMQNCTIRNNKAIGRTGSGADAHGGGIYIQGGTASLSNVTLDSNTAEGGNGPAAPKGGGGNGRTSSGGHNGGHLGPGNGGNGVGGGIYVAGGSVTLLNTSMSNNTAMGGLAGGKKANNGQGIAGGLYIDPTASVSLDAFTQAHIINNTASTADPNIDGSYTTV